jgi:lycopene beta-cyclase
MIYDYIIAGAGLGGLSFINHLLEEESSFSSVLIIDPDPKNVNDRTWSFWSMQQPSYACALRKSWTKLGFASDDYLEFEAVDPYHYYTIRGIDFYQEVLDKIRNDLRFEFIHATITDMVGTDNSVTVATEAQEYQAHHLIDSISRPNLIDTANDNIVLSQNFLGWSITTNKPSFDPEKPILMDFRVTQSDAASFVYFLPYSENEALVEYTQFSSKFEFDQKAYAQEITHYIFKYLGVDEYTVNEKEIGKIPMTNCRFDNRPHQRIFRIGTAGGDTKATTGYTFMNVQRHAHEILQELHGQKTSQTDKSRFDYYDTLLLQIIRDRPAKVKTIMEFLFKNQPMSRVLKFLDEETTLPEEMLIFGQLPWEPFLSTILRRTRNALIS